MKSKKWLWILLAVVLVVAVIVTAICLTKCNKDDDPRKTSIILTKETSSGVDFYDAEVMNGKNGKTYVFKSNANEHLTNLYIIQADSENPIDSNSYELKMYNKDYEEILITYDATRNTITLKDENGLWNAVYEKEDVYFAITLKTNTSFKLKLQKNYS